MKDYLNATDRARTALWSGVLGEEEPADQLSRDLIGLNRLQEAVLSTPDSGLRKPNPFSEDLPSDFDLRVQHFRDNWGREPTPDAIAEALE